MLYALLCTDKPNSTDLRAQVRPEHLAYLNGLGEKMKFAGPFVSDDGASVGSLMMIEAESRTAAEKIAEDDPYRRAGLFAAVEIKAWRWTLKNPEVK